MNKDLIEFGKKLEELGLDWYYGTYEYPSDRVLIEEKTEGECLKYPIVTFRTEYFENITNKERLQIVLENLAARYGLDDIMTFSEASKKWGIDGSTLRKALGYKRFNENEIRKSGDVWLVTKEAMERVYGKIN